jgi:nucleotide-binding universal stress UspA family protein
MPILNVAVVTTTPIELNVVGVVIAIVFLSSIICVLGWMLRLPKETARTRAATQAVRSVTKLTRILVPLLRTSELTDRLVALASQMVRARDGQVELLAVIEVTFMLPLDAHVEEDERQALDALECAEAIARRSTSRVIKRILKARRAGTAIVREAEERAADMILMANHPARVGGAKQQLDPAVEYVIKNAPCEVLILSQGHSETPLAGREETERKAMTAGQTR